MRRVEKCALSHDAFLRCVLLKTMRDAHLVEDGHPIKEGRPGASGREAHVWMATECRAVYGCAKPLSTECRTGTTATFRGESGFCCFGK